MRPCQSCGTAVGNREAACPNCGADFEQQVQVTPVKVPSREAQREEEIWLRSNIIAPSLFLTLIITSGSVGTMGWLGFPVGLLISAILSLFLFIVLPML